MGYLLSLLLLSHDFHVVPVCDKKNTEKLQKLGFSPHEIFNYHDFVAKLGSEFLQKGSNYCPQFFVPNGSIQLFNLLLDLLLITKKQNTFLLSLFPPYEGIESTRVNLEGYKHLFYVNIEPYIINSRLYEIHSQQMDVFPSFKPLKPYHLIFPQIMDKLQDYIVKNTSLKSFANIDSIYSFDEAVLANQKMDDGDYSGKIVISMDSLINGKCSVPEIQFLNINSLTEFVVPSEVALSLLHNGNPGPVSAI